LTNRPGFTDLWRLNIASLKRERLIANAGGVISQKPQPSPDGKSIAFFRGQTLMLAGADGQGEHILWDAGNPAHWPEMAWSPDSSQILVPAYSNGPLVLNLLTLATRQVRPLVPWRGRFLSMVWPSWSSGPFLCGFVLPPGLTGDTQPESQIWHLSLPQEEWTQVTKESPGYLRIFGAGADGYSLVAQRRAPRPGLWELFVDFLATNGPDQHGSGFAVAPPAGFQPTVVLMLKK
jgi:Tol biopolymer transport system component